MLTLASNVPMLSKMEVSI